ncbi:MAG TPA: hypothetical protein ENK28_04935 [Aliiroseovarius sp.]|nr:hypothetical protein [Aliiroseovarius sp.]
MMARPTPAPDMARAILALHRKYADVPTMARLLGRSEGYIRAKLSNLDLAAHRAPLRRADQRGRLRRRQIVAARIGDVSVADLATRFRVSASAIYHDLRVLGLTPTGDAVPAAPEEVSHG